jgi:hypothetical protein
MVFGCVLFAIDPVVRDGGDNALMYVTEVRCHEVPTGAAA